MLLSGGDCRSEEAGDLPRRWTDQTEVVVGVGRCSVRVIVMIRRPIIEEATPYRFGP